eukprot:scaffold10462_cov119-Isochrysis_galbana.AAC.12
MPGTCFGCRTMCGVDGLVGTQPFDAPGGVRGRPFSCWRARRAWIWCTSRSDAHLLTAPGTQLETSENDWCTVFLSISADRSAVALDRRSRAQELLSTKLFHSSEYIERVGALI